MLVLSRKKDESIIIDLGDRQVSIRVLDIKGGRVSLGVNAPGDVSIRRDELMTTHRRWHGIRGRSRNRVAEAAKRRCEQCSA